MTATVAARAAGTAAVARGAESHNRADALARVRAICAVSLMLGAGLHLNVGMTHAGSNFATLSLLASAAQFTLGLLIYLGRMGVVTNAVVVLSLVLVQLYLLNVTIGLPPIIAHTHGGADHVLWGHVFASPGVIDMEGVSAMLSEVLAAIAGSALLRTRR